MQDKELNILEVLYNNENITQREIAKQTGMSLGMVNLLIKRCAKKGLIKIEGLNPRSIRYILTPKGIKEKTKKTLEYINKSYRAIIKITNFVKAVTKEQSDKKRNIYIYGSKDEMYQLITNILKEMGIPFSVINNIDDIKTKNDIIVYLWHPDVEEEVKKLNLNYINIFTMKKTQT